MIVKKFNEFIEEGFMTRSLNRKKSNDERLGDQLPSNLKSFKEINLNLPFVFADVDLEINGKDTFTFNEFDENYKNYFLKHGWRLPTYNELKNSFKDFKFISRLDSVSASSPETGESLVINLTIGEKLTFYMLGYSESSEHIKNRQMCPVWIFDNTTEFNDFGSTRVEHEVRIRLVKDKK